MYLYSLIHINLFLFAYSHDYALPYFLAYEFLNLFYNQGVRDTFILSGLCFGEILMYIGSFMGYLIFVDSQIKWKENNKI